MRCWIHHLFKRKLEFVFGAWEYSDIHTLLLCNDCSKNKLLLFDRDFETPLLRIRKA